MSENNFTVTPAPQEKNQQHKQLKMNIEGYVIKLNFVQPTADNPMEAVKKMILSGLSKM